MAITGVSGFLGQRLLPSLEGIADRIVGLDVREPARRVRRLEFHLVDIGGADLKPLLEGVDVVVHLATIAEPLADETLMAHVNVQGTRRLLDAAAAVGVSKLVRLSSANVYGAWANNPVPLTEDAPLRPNPGFAPAVQAAEVERILAEWRDEHPAVVVTALRSAIVLGVGADHLGARLLAGHPPLRVSGASPPVQFVHADDVVAALVLTVQRDLPGVFNVAADSWLPADDARALIPHRLAPALPEQLAQRALRVTWASGLGVVPPSILPYLEFPWVIANDRLKATGWAPTHTNEEALIAGFPSAASASSTTVLRYAGMAAGAVAAGAAIGWAARKRHRKGPRG